MHNSDGASFFHFLYCQRNAMKSYNAILIGNGTMGARHRARFEACGVRFVQIVDVGDTVKNCDVDFAVIASPASTHYAYAKFFLERQTPVFVEKPLATSAEEAQELVNFALRNGVTLFVAQSECYNPIFLNFRKHFLAELRSLSGAHLEFRREHRPSNRCLDVGVSLDLMVHDFSLFLTMFPYRDIRVESIEESPNGNRARAQLKVVSGPFAGVSADFVVDRESATDLRNITVNFPRNGELPSSSYTVSLARYTPEGEIAHIPDSLDNEHKFFLKLLAGACGHWGRRAAQNAADCVKLAVSYER
jgi:hypothetical protein